MPFATHTACFLAALPHRQALYQSGGWQTAPRPATDGFRLWLHQFYTPSELTEAERAVSAQLKTTATGNARQPAHQKWAWISIWQAEYPWLLRQIFDPPPILFYRLVGKRYPDQQDEMLSVVGTRKPHRLARLAITERLDQWPGEPDQTRWLVSGFALGVDRLAHSAALERQIGTIAVLGAGLEHTGPRANLDLIRLAQIKQGNLLFLSEFLPWQRAQAWHFVRRNRIIAGLSPCTCVVQAPERSGALITARYALDEGREVEAFDTPLWQKIRGLNEGGRQLLDNGARTMAYI
ncbi:MAG: DNA-protecting protein DprA [Leptospiraceae bacterium]|nr:DNA-protecting protein DprA [Leptospiraceae bacterium]